jgi:hypothetical protein
MPYLFLSDTQLVIRSRSKPSLPLSIRLLRISRAVGRENYMWVYLGIHEIWAVCLFSGNYCDCSPLLNWHSPRDSGAPCID